MILQISNATHDDLSEILALQKECYQTEAQLYNDYNIRPLTQDLKSIEADFMNGMCFLKGVVDRQIVASVRGITTDGVSHIGRLIVKSEFENRKFGQAMMQAIELELGRCIRYELFTGDKSERNIYIYKKMGYEEFKREKMNDKLTLVYLTKNRMERT